MKRSLVITLLMLAAGVAIAAYNVLYPTKVVDSFGYVAHRPASGGATIPYWHDSFADCRIWWDMESTNVSGHVIGYTNSVNADTRVGTPHLVIVGTNQYGRVEHGLYFDGTNDVQGKYNAWIVPTNAGTMMCWFLYRYTNDLSSLENLMAMQNGDTTTTQGVLQCDINLAKTYQTKLPKSTSGQGTLNVGDSLIGNTWTHLCVVWSNNPSTDTWLYKDGSLIASGDKIDVGLSPGVTNVWVGASYNGVAPDTPSAVVIDEAIYLGYPIQPTELTNYVAHSYPPSNTVYRP